MLHTETVESVALSVLKQLMTITELKDFSLVGGTALSLYYGHRKSIDLDLFSPTPINNTIVIDTLKKVFEDKFVMEEKPPHFGIFCYLKDVKVDFVFYPHSQIRPGLLIDGIRMFSIEDIMAMKVQAILGRGRKKDFWDVAELLNHYTVQDFIRFHKEKYASQNLLITVPQAITYFADAEESEEPISMKNQTWDSIKGFISSKVRVYLE
jgi:predicted nucleotidyltransferase component of viral defense system